MNTEERKIRVQEVVNKISASSRGLSSLNRKRKAVSKETEDVKPIKESKSRKSTYKLHIGWLNWQRGKFRQVSYKNGGGTREFLYEKDEPQSVEKILEVSKKYFFPNGKSQYGMLSTMEVCLSNFNGDKIDRFETIDGGECSLQEHLKSAGIYSSQYYVYLRTQCLENESLKQSESPELNLSAQNSEAGSTTEIDGTDENQNVRKLGFLVNGRQPGRIAIKYTQVKESLYDESKICMTCHSMKTCYDTMPRPNESFEEYNPFLDNFRMTALSVNEQPLLETDNDGRLLYHTETGVLSSETLIVYTPHDVNGLESAGSDEEHLVLGLVLNSNGIINSSVSHTVSWYKDGNLIYTGENLSAISVKQPGLYNVEVQLNTGDSETIYKIDPPVNITVAEAEECEKVDPPVNIALTEKCDKVDTSAKNLEIVAPTVYIITANECDSLIQPVKRTVAENFDKVDPPLNVSIAEGESCENIDPPVNMALSKKCDNIETPAENSEVVAATVYITTADRYDSVFPPVEGTIAENRDKADQPVNIITSLAENYDKINLPLNTNRTKSLEKFDPHVNVSMAEKCENIEPPVSKAYDTIELPLNKSIAGKVNNVDPPGNVTLAENNYKVEPSVSLAQAEKCGNVDPSTDKAIAEKSKLFDPPFSITTVKNRDMVETCTPVNMTLAEKHDNVDLSVNTTKTENYSKVETVNIQRVDVSALQILDKIGDGAFGEVFKGNWLETSVAVKKVKVKRMRVYKKAILQEVQVHSEIRHPNIILLMAYALSTDHIYLVSEYINGSNLDDMLFGENDKKIDIPRKNSIAHQLCLAVCYLHNRYPVVIHRDIKPENVIVSEGTDIVKLCDMGLSKLKTLNTVATTCAHKAELQSGTPVYQAPEVLVKKQKGSRESDIWSLSCTLCELYSEEPIWNLADNDDSIDFVIDCMSKSERPHGLDHFQEPSYLRELLCQGLEYDPSLRPKALAICRVMKSLL